MTSPAAVSERGRATRRSRTEAALESLTRLWREAGGPDSGAALACTGSLARGELGPRSDLDLVLVHDGSNRRIGDLADRIWYPLWDSEFTLDHSVRTVEECRRAANDDLSVAAAMLDLSPVAGDFSLVHKGIRQLGDDWRANARKRLPEVLDQVRGRHQRFGTISELLEPDLKQSAGGLRDMGVLRAITTSWLADRPHGATDRANEWLLDVRDEVHRVTGRPRTHLFLADQDEIAEATGCADADDLLSRVYNASRTLSVALQQTLRRAGQSQRARLRRPGPRRPELTPRGHGLYVSDGEVVLGRGADPHDELLALRAAVIAAEGSPTTGGEPLAVSPATLTRLAALPEPAAPWSARGRALFTELLASPHLVGVWNSYDLAGMVDAWIPCWEGIRDRPQRNSLHRHTVDRHSLETVLQAQPLLGSVRRPDLLLLAALLHDVGKQCPGGDHGRTGAELAGPVLTRLGLLPSDRDTVVGLVRHHLTLAELATGRDISDPRTAAELAGTVGHDLDRLGLLAALTEADARAAGPRTWSTGRAALIHDLVRRTVEAITAAPSTSTPAESSAR